MEKTWGGEPFWGLGYDWDPDWLLTERQKELRAKLIELCEKEMRANAKRSDDELLYPSRNFEILAENGFMSLTVPEEYGGLGENHVAYAMVCETLARYGCASTAMCYVMHISAVATLMLRPTPELIDKYIRPLNDGKVGTLSYSDPETGSHFWYPFSSSAERSNGGYKVNKKASWTTSGGIRRLLRRADHEPGLQGLRRPVGIRDRRRAREGQALALGRARPARQPVRARSRWTECRSPTTRSSGRSATAPPPTTRPWTPGSWSAPRRCGTGSRWARSTSPERHTTRKRHVDVGMRVADYPTIQDYVGEAVMDTNTCRVFVLSVANAMDRVTDDNRRVLEPGETARADYLHWAWQIKFEAAKNTAHHVDKMLHACGGSGYKRDMELERYVRDAKAGWVMGPTNEVLRQFVGKAVLMGFDALDYWNQTYNRRVVENEVKKLDAAGKRDLAKQLSEQADKDEAKEPAAKA